MDAVLSKLGVGALLACVALPLFARLVRPGARPDAVTLHRAQVAVLASAIALLAVPWLPIELPDWLAPRTPYYAVELRAVFAPVSDELLFGADEAPATLSPLSLIGAFWIIAVAFATIQRALGARHVARILAMAVAAPPALLDSLRVRAAAQRMAAPRLLVSDRTTIPFAAGIVRPAIVLPRALVETLEPSALELILEHELEHVRRGDLRMAAFLSALQCLLGDHPTAEMIAREALLAREVAVDARVSRNNARAYATLLVDIAAHAHFGEKPAATAIDDTALARRIALITEPAAMCPLRAWPVVLSAVAIAALALAAPSFIRWSDQAPSVRDLHVAPPGPAFAVAGLAHQIAFAPGDPPRRLRRVREHLGVPLPERVMRSAEVAECYAQARSAQPDLTVHARVHLRAGAAGAVTVTVHAPDAPELGRCLEGAVQQLSPQLQLPRDTDFMLGLLLGPETMSR